VILACRTAPAKTDSIEGGIDFLKLIFLKYKRLWHLCPKASLIIFWIQRSLPFG
jgi:hypothetical protein